MCSSDLTFIPAHLLPYTRVAHPATAHLRRQVGRMDQSPVARELVGSRRRVGPTCQPVLWTFLAVISAATYPSPRPPTGFVGSTRRTTFGPWIYGGGRFLLEWSCYAVQSSLYIRHVEDGPEAEDCSWAEGDLVFENDGHGDSVDRRHTPYLERQLSMFCV